MGRANGAVRGVGGAGDGRVKAADIKRQRAGELRLAHLRERAVQRTGYTREGMQGLQATERKQQVAQNVAWQSRDTTWSAGLWTSDAAKVLFAVMSLLASVFLFRLLWKILLTVFAPVLAYLAWLNLTTSFFVLSPVYWLLCALSWFGDLRSAFDILIPVSLLLLLMLLVRLLWQLLSSVLGSVFAPIVPVFAPVPMLLFSLLWNIPLTVLAPVFAFLAWLPLTTSFFVLSPVYWLLCGLLCFGLWRQRDFHIAYLRAHRWYKFRDQRRRLRSNIDRDRCSVCLDDLRNMNRDSILTLVCGHTFHDDCIRPWIALRHHCPTCMCDLRF